MAERLIKSLSDLMDGGVEERFNDALAKVWENVYDPNTEPTKSREVVMKVKIVPNERRDSCDFRVDIIPKLAPPNSLSQTVMLNIGSDGEIIATERTEQVPGQINMEGQESPLPRVMKFTREAEAN